MRRQPTEWEKYFQMILPSKIYNNIQNIKAAHATWLKKKTKLIKDPWGIFPKEDMKMTYRHMKKC